MVANWGETSRVCMFVCVCVCVCLSVCLSVWEEGGRISHSTLLKAFAREENAFVTGCFFERFRGGVVGIPMGRMTREKGERM